MTRRPEARERRREFRYRAIRRTVVDEVARRGDMMVRRTRLDNGQTQVAEVPLSDPDGFLTIIEWERDALTQARRALADPDHYVFEIRPRMVGPHSTSIARQVSDRSISDPRWSRETPWWWRHTIEHGWRLTHLVSVQTQ